MLLVSLKMHFSYFMKHLVILVVSSVGYSAGISCKNEDCQDVDWYINYKLPKLERGFPGTHVSRGTAYAHISSTEPEGWRLSPHSVTSESSMLARTLQTFFANKEQSTYLFYNDDPPHGYNGTANGHLKGVVAFDGETGFWLVHSIPRSFKADVYSYPHNALENGQSVLCLTFKTSVLNEICRHLLYCSPKIYERRLTAGASRFLDDVSKSLFARKPAFNRRPPFVRVATLVTAGGEIVKSFAKDGQFRGDMYSAVLAPRLRTSLAAATWRRGSGTFLPPACDGPFAVTDVERIRMTAANGTRAAVLSFSSKEDHSKWAVSLDSAPDSWVCIGDLNRMASQGRRGGGSVCFQSQGAGDAFRSLVARTDTCSLPD